VRGWRAWFNPIRDDSREAHRGVSGFEGTCGQARGAFI
jgi:hypothetical protein